MAKYTVSLRGGFSDRNGIKVENTSIQIKEFDHRTRVALVNAIDKVINIRFDQLRFTSNKPGQCFLRQILSEVYGQIVDCNKRYDYEAVLNIIKDTIMSDDYDAVLSVVEYIINVIDSYPYFDFLSDGIRYNAGSFINAVFTREFVGYRFIAPYITAITDDVEVKAIDDALNNKSDNVKQHIEKALGLLSDREAPDYANSIKESISAVERMCSIIVGHKATLNDALKEFEKCQVEIHPALKRAFSQLYGYTSDASGIRHSGELGGKDSTFEEAKFMLVSCCAFVNYLTGIMAKK